MADFLLKLFDTSDFPARWTCGHWEAGHGYLHIASDLGVWSAYTAIPAVLAYFAFRKKGLPFQRVFLLFVAFILLCGLTHLMDAVIFYWPAYRLSGALKFSTAVVSWATVVALVRVVPKVLTLRTPGELEAEVAEREKAVTELRRSQRRYQALFEAAADAIVTVDSSGRIVGWNLAAEREFGYAAADAVGKPFERLLPARMVPSTSDRTPLGISTERQREMVGKPVEMTARHRTGRHFPVEFTLTSWYEGEDLFYTAILRNVSARKHSEEQLRQSQEQFRAAFDRAGIGAALVSRDGDFLRVNPALCRMLGYTADELLNTNFQSLTHVDDLTRDFGQIRRMLAGEISSYTLQKRYWHKTGALVWAELSVAAVPDGAGGVLHFVSQVQDVTERKRAEEGLRLRERAIEAIPQGVAISDPSQGDNPLLYVNRGFEELTGYTAPEVLGRNCRFLQGPRTDPATVRVMREAIEAGRAVTVELINYRKDGTPFWNALSIAPVRSPRGQVTHYVAAQTDTTPFRRLEEQFRQVQKMEAVGLLAGGVAHDFNNLLQVINGYAELVLQGRPDDDPVAPYIREILSTGWRAAELTRQLLAFSRRQVLQPRRLDLNELVRNLERMLARLIGEDVELTTALLPKLPDVVADAGQLEQVLMNLAVNARDAMPTGGKLTIETDAVELDAAYCAEHADVRPGTYVLLAVSDTGGGMPPEVLAKIWEPFFTTKGPGQGTGLGLATVYGIVRQSGGHVGVYSEVGRGTAFKVYLPTRYTEAGLTPEAPRKAVAPRGRETVLLVEDESKLRTLTAVMLRNAGYAVRDAANWRDAEAAFDDGGVDLLLTDVVMPEVGGRELAERLRGKRPDLKVVYMSGYTDDAVVRHGVLSKEMAFLPKPFATVDLLTKVREALDGAGR